MKTVRLTDDLKALGVSIQDRAPTEDDLVNIAAEQGLSVGKTLLLLLKHQWETRSRASDVHGPGQDGNDGGLAHGPELRNRPNTDALYALVRQVTGNSRIDREDFEDLVGHMVLAELYRRSVSSPEVERIEESWLKDRRLHDEAETQEQRDRLSERQLEWRLGREELGDVCAATDVQLRMNARVDHEFLNVFGDEYVALREQQASVEGLSQRIALKSRRADATYDEIERMMQEREEHRARQLTDLKRDNLPFPREMLPMAPIAIISPEEMAERKKQCRDLAVEIWCLAHDDRLARHPDFEKLTDGQRRKLRQYLSYVQRTRKGALMAPPGTIGFSEPSPEDLAWIRDRVRSVLEEAGVDLDVALLPQGETIEERIEWYEREIAYLQEDIETARAELVAAVEDTDVAERRQILASTDEEREGIRAQMKEKTRQLEEEARRLEVELGQLFEEAA